MNLPKSEKGVGHKKCHPIIKEGGKATDSLLEGPQLWERGGGQNLAMIAINKREGKEGWLSTFYREEGNGLWEDPNISSAVKRGENFCTHERRN